jgi:hypothetical protein
MTPTTAPRIISGLCQEFIDIIKKETEPHPLVVRDTFKFLANQLSRTHPVFDVTQASVHQFSALITRNGPEALEPLQIDPGKPLPLILLTG